MDLPHIVRDGTAAVLGWRPAGTSSGTGSVPQPGLTGMIHFGQVANLQAASVQHRLAPEHRLGSGGCDRVIEQADHVAQRVLSLR
jgi:hypothetical protein